MISAVILNWERPYNLKHIILPLLEQCSQIDEIIISHGKLDTAFDYESERCRMVHRHDYGDVNRQYGMARRFLAYEDATNEVILSLDDDIVIPESSLSALHDEFVSDPEVIHSLYGRNPDRRLRYCDHMRFGEVTYALPNAALLPKRLGDLFFEYAPLVDGLAKHWPFWSVEDLFMSLVAIKTNRRPNRAHPLPRIDLRNGPRGVGPRAISETPGHLEDRSRFSRRAISALQVGDLIRTSPGYSVGRRLRKSLGKLRTGGGGGGTSPCA